MTQILTITELLEKYGDMFLESTVESIKQSKSMPTKTKKSLMNQLDHYFESSAYLKGNRSKPPRFELGALRQPVTPYEITSRGRPKKDFTNERNAMMFEILKISEKNDELTNEFEFKYITWSKIARTIYNLNNLDIQAMNFYASPENLNYKANEIPFVFHMAGSSAIVGRKERFTDRDLKKIPNDINYLVTNKLSRMKTIFYELLSELNYSKKYLAVIGKGYQHEEVDADEFEKWTEKRDTIHKEMIEKGNNSLKALRLANEQMKNDTKYLTMYAVYGFYGNKELKSMVYPYDKNALISDMDNRILSSVTREQERYNQIIASLNSDERLIESSSLSIRLKRCGEYHDYMSKFLQAVRNDEIPKSKSVALKKMESEIWTWKCKEAEKERQIEMLKAEEGIITDGAKS